MSMLENMQNVSINRRSLVAGAAGLGLAGVLAGCSNEGDGSGAGSASGSASGSAFMIGGIGPTTGDAAIYGNGVRIGAQIAIDEINAEGGDIQFDYNFQDDENDAERSVNAYNNLKDWGMQILMGTVTTAPCVAVSAETNADNMFQITPSGSSTDVIGGQPDADGNIATPRKENVFQMCFTDPNQGAASAQYISEQQLGTKIAIIYNNSDTYSTGIYQSFMSEASELVSRSCPSRRSPTTPPPTSPYSSTPRVTPRPTWSSCPSTTRPSRSSSPRRARWAMRPSGSAWTAWTAC